MFEVHAGTVQWLLGLRKSLRGGGGGGGGVVFKGSRCCLSDGKKGGFAGLWECV